jgi:hypothetical protein
MPAITRSAATPAAIPRTTATHMRRGAPQWVLSVRRWTPQATLRRDSARTCSVTGATDRVAPGVLTRWRSRYACSGLLVPLAASIGCAGTLDDPGRFLDAADSDVTESEASVAVDAQLSGADEVTSSPTCGDAPEEIFLPNCTGTGCHNSQDKAQGLDLQSPNLATRLIGVPATEGPGLLIDPTTPSSSVLYAKVTAIPPFGARMPLGATPLSSQTISCVLAWITQEATAAPSGSEAGTFDDADETDAGVEDASEQ